jgi:hypothetical protein
MKKIFKDGALSLKKWLKITTSKEGMESNVKKGTY